MSVSFAFMNSHRVTVAIAVWAAMVVGGLGVMVRYQSTAAANQQPAPDVWPAASSLQRNTSGTTLVLSLHPKCPCSHATVSELAQVLARANGPITAYVIFIQPAGVTADWTHDDLWNQASAIPGVTVLTDANGRESGLFRATVSGQIAAYDATGHRLFTGGITDGRGHEGDNPGVDAVIAIARNQQPQLQRAPVYGCGLNSCPRGEEKK